MDQRVIDNTTDQNQMMPIHCLEIRPTLTHVNLSYVEYYLMCLEVRDLFGKLCQLSAWM